MRKALLILGFGMGCVLILLGIILRPSLLGLPHAEPFAISRDLRNVRALRVVLVSVGFLVVSLAVVARESGGRLLKRLISALRDCDGFYDTKSSSE